MPITFLNNIEAFGSLNASGAGSINANTYNNSSIITIDYGGTNSTSANYTNGGIFYFNGSQFVTVTGTASSPVLYWSGSRFYPTGISAITSSTTFADIQSQTGVNNYWVSGQLRPTGGGTVDANRFNGNSIISVANGGTSATSFTASGILYGQGTAALTTSSTNSFNWSDAAKSLNICSDARQIASINIGNGSEETLLPRPIFSLPSTYSLTATPTTGTIEYNTTGLYLTDGVGSRKRLVNISDTATSGQIAAYNGIYWVPIDQTAGGGLTQSQVLARGLGR